MPKLKNIAKRIQINPPAVKGLFLMAIMIGFSAFTATKHPFYLSVVDIKHDTKTQHLNISVKLFINDIENALKKITTKPIDLLNPKSKPEMEMELMNYVKQRLSIDINFKPYQLNFIGYEKEEDAIWIYLDIKKVVNPKSLKIKTSLLYDFLPLQTNIVHCEIKGVKKSSKITNPDKTLEFTF